MGLLRGRRLHAAIQHLTYCLTEKEKTSCRCGDAVLENFNQQTIDRILQFIGFLNRRRLQVVDREFQIKAGKKTIRADLLVKNTQTQKYGIIELKSGYRKGNDEEHRKNVNQTKKYRTNWNKGQNPFEISFALLYYIDNMISFLV